MGSRHDTWGSRCRRRERRCREPVRFSNRNDKYNVVISRRAGERTRTCQWGRASRSHTGCATRRRADVPNPVRRGPDGPAGSAAPLGEHGVLATLSRGAEQERLRTKASAGSQRTAARAKPNPGRPQIAGRAAARNTGDEQCKRQGLLSLSYPCSRRVRPHRCSQFGERDPEARAPSDAPDSRTRRSTCHAKACARERSPCPPARAAPRTPARARPALTYPHTFRAGPRESLAKTPNLPGGLS